MREYRLIGGEDARGPLREPMLGDASRDEKTFTKGVWAWASLARLAKEAEEMGLLGKASDRIMSGLVYGERGAAAELSPVPGRVPVVVGREAGGEVQLSFVAVRTLKSGRSSMVQSRRSDERRAANDSVGAKPRRKRANDTMARSASKRTGGDRILRSKPVL